MSETYVTYRVWDGCKAPANLEYNGRLIGQIARESTIDRDALLALERDIMDDAADIGRLQLSIYGACYLSGIAKRIREALGVEHG